MTGDKLKFLLAGQSQITNVYLMFGAVWMLATEQLAVTFSESLHIQTCKGVQFCVCSSALIFLSNGLENEKVENSEMRVTESGSPA
jgi:hypothetical protein